MAVMSRTAQKIANGMSVKAAMAPQGLTAEIEGNELVIRIPLQSPRPSASGKTLVVATTGGNKQTDAMVNGRPITVGVNAYIAK